MIGHLRLISILFLVFCFSSVCLGQDGDVVLFDSIPEANYEIFANRIDFLAVKVNEAPLSKGFIVVYEGNDDIQNAFIRESIFRYIRFRRFDETRLVVLNATESNGSRVDFLISKFGTRPQVNEMPINYVLPKTTEAQLFAEDTIEVTVVDGKKTWYSAGCENCISQLDPSLLSRFLKSNSELKAFIIINSRSHKKARKARDILRSEWNSDFGTSARLIFLYGGQLSADSNSGYADVVVYLTKDRSQLPVSAGLRYKSF